MLTLKNLLSTPRSGSVHAWNQQNLKLIIFQKYLLSVHEMLISQAILVFRLLKEQFTLKYSLSFQCVQIQQKIINIPLLSLFQKTIIRSVSKLPKITLQIFSQPSKTLLLINHLEYQCQLYGILKDELIKLIIGTNVM